MRVSEVMSRNLVTSHPSDSCREAVARMSRARIRHLPVIAEDGRVVGIVTDRDLRHRLFTPEVFEKIGDVPVEQLLAAVPVRDIMSSPVTTVDADAELAEAAQTMLEDKVGSIVVVEDERPVGILTETDLLRCIVRADDAAWAPVDVVVSFP
jgi:acetoin utilization protein AcuB